MQIRYRFDVPDFWLRLGRSASYLVLACLISGYVGMVIGMLLTRRFISELSGFGHILLIVPLSSLIVGVVVWSVILSVLYLHVSADGVLDSSVVLTATIVASGVVLVLQAVVWVLLVRLGGQ